MSRKCPTCGSVFSDDVSFCGHDGAITIEEQDPGDVDPRLGQQLGDFIVCARVADGAMGRVYEARHPDTKHRVAVKILHPDVAKDGVAVERFKREYETAEELDHPNIVKVLDFGDTPDGSHFMTMEYLEGEELSGLIRRAGPQPPERTIHVVAQVCAALAHAHSYGVIHRDLKPDNIFLCRTEAGYEVRILDFGSVKLQMETGPKLTAFGTTLGSPYYMSPEQAMGKLDVDQRTDVFAIAAILFEMITGKVAFEGNNVAEILMKIVNHEPPPPSGLNPRYPASIDDVVSKGIHKDKTQRFGSTKELADAVVTAFGLQGDHAQWAATPEAEIQAALASAKPPAPVPFGTSAGSGSPSGLSGSPGVSAGLPIALVLAVAGFGVLIVVGVALALLLT